VPWWRVAAGVVVTCGLLLATSGRYVRHIRPVAFSSTVDTRFTPSYVLTYVTDIAPERVLPGSKATIGPERLAQGFMSRWQLSARLFTTPWKASGLTHFLEIDVSGLNVLNPRPGTYLIPGETALDLTGRITRGGQF
jgi:HYD1 signature containing ADP-ribosyltransferase